MYLYIDASNKKRQKPFYTSIQPTHARLQNVSKGSNFLLIDTFCFLQPSFPPGQPTAVVFATPQPPQMNPPPQPRQVGPSTTQHTKLKVRESIPSLLAMPRFLKVYIGQIFVVTIELEQCMSWLFCPSDAVAVFMFAVFDASHCSDHIFCQLETAVRQKKSQNLWLKCDSTC